jgi:hypothetical protein
MGAAAHHRRVGHAHQARRQRRFRGDDRAQVGEGGVRVVHRLLHAQGRIGKRWQFELAGGEVHAQLAYELESG